MKVESAQFTAVVSGSDGNDPCTGGGMPNGLHPVYDRGFVNAVEHMDRLLT